LFGFLPQILFVLCAVLVYLCVPVFNAGHEMGVCPTAVTAALEPFSTFNFKAKFFVKMDGGRVVGVNF
jgi:hypothetical protein